MNADQQDLGLNDESSVATSNGDGSYSETEQLTEALSGGGDASFVVGSEPKSIHKSTVFLFLVLVLGAGSIWFMYKKTGPKAAAAATTKESVEAKKTISTFLSGGDSNIKVMETMLRNTQKVVQQFLSYPSMTQVPLSDLRTNPFRFKLTTPTASSDESGDIAEKRRREEERQAILKAVQGLQLQSIMYSDARKACMINNTLYREGQPVEGFSIERIEQNSVVVKNGPYRFELRMQR